KSLDRRPGRTSSGLRSLRHPLAVVSARMLRETHPVGGRRIVMDTSTKPRPRSPGQTIPIEGTVPSTSPATGGERPLNGEGGRRRLRTEFGRVFYRSFPILLILFGFGILAIIGLWAKMAASDGPTTGSSAAAGAPVTLNVSLSEFSIDPATIQVPAGKPFVLHVTTAGQA